jgi:methionyl-tRNA formyltransferase
VKDAGHEVAALVTQPDREKGRGRHVTPPPVKPLAERLGVPVMQPRRIRDEEAVLALRALLPEVLIVVAYGQILPKAVLDLAPRGAVNVHGSLLPRWRGAAPIQWAIAAGDTETGVTTMLLDEGLDTGPILLARSTPIGTEETAADLQPRLAELGAELLVSTLAGLEDGSLRPKPQDAAKATRARILEKEDGRVDWSFPAAVIA